jgi:hypothetical protein
MYHEWIAALTDGRYLTEPAAKCTADARFGFGQYTAIWDPSGNTANRVPPGKHKEAWYFYFARARGCTRLASTGTFNSVVAWGLWSPERASYHLFGGNWSVNQELWDRVAQDNESRSRVPIVSCPYVVSMPPATYQDAAHVFIQGSWVALAAHRGNQVVNFGSTDGSVIAINVKTVTTDEAARDMYYKYWERKF